MALENELFVILEQELFGKALANIINNAIVHSEEHSSIYVTTKQSGSECILTVKNMSSSIPADEIQHVFEPFYKVDKSRTGNGTGLGLYIVKVFFWNIMDFGFVLRIRKTVLYLRLSCH